MGMTKKCFAAILSAGETTKRIKEITDAAKGQGPEAAEKALQEIAALNDKYCADFGDVDPYWQPPEKKTDGPARSTYVPPEAYEEEILS